MTFTSEDAQAHVGHHLYDAEGHKIGKIEQIANGARRTPDWAFVHIGLLGGKKRLVPITAATPFEDGLAVPYSKDTVEAAPGIDPELESLTPEMEATLHAYYGGREDLPADTGEADPDRFRVRPHSNETSFGTGEPAAGEPDDVTLQGTGNSAPRNIV